MTKTAKWRKPVISIIIVVLCVAFIVCCITTFGKYQMSKIPNLTFWEALEYTTKNNADALITVGIIDNGEISYKVYGENGKERPAELYMYEIGSLTKTFTAALISRAVAENRINLDSPIDSYLPLPSGDKYPTVKELLTHTSGCKAYYFERPMIANRLSRRNDFYGITKEMVLKKAERLNSEDKRGRFLYSNYGYAVLGLVLEAVYGVDYPTLVNDFAQNELGLTATGISDKCGSMGNYWDWNDTDAYLSAGGITSNIDDMLSYAQMQLEDNTFFMQCHKPIEHIDGSSEEYKTMGINMDEIGMSWIIDSKNGVIWHNGGTGSYNSYLGFNPETGTAVVVLSNLSPNYRIPATILGVKLLSELE